MMNRKMGRNYNWRLVRKSWAIFLSGDKSEVLRFLVFFIRSKPIFLYISIISILHFNWWSVIAIPVAYWMNQLLTAFFSQRHSYFKLDEMVHKLILHYEEKDIESLNANKYLVSDYLDAETYHKLDSILKRKVGLIGRSWSLDDKIQIYHVHAKNVNLQDYVCYNIPPFKSYIFLLSAPHSTNEVFVKFLILHEIAHNALDSRSPEVFIQHSDKFYAVFAFFTLLLFPWNVYPVWGMIGLLLLWFTTNIEKRIIYKRQKLSDEISADMMAFQFISLEEKKELLNDYFSQYKFFDESLKYEENEARYKLRIQYLKYEIYGFDSEPILIPDLKSFHFRTPTCVLLFQILLVSLLAIYSNGYGGIITGLICIAVFVVAFCYSRTLLRIEACEIWIKNRLDSWPLATYEQ